MLLGKVSTQVILGEEYLLCNFRKMASHSCVYAITRTLRAQLLNLICKVSDCLAFYSLKFPVVCQTCILRKTRPAGRQK